MDREFSAKVSSNDKVYDILALLFRNNFAESALSACLIPEKQTFNCDFISPCLKLQTEQNVLPSVSGFLKPLIFKDDNFTLKLVKFYCNRKIHE